MSAASIPVDLFNPGQVFACLGFLEAADVLLGNAEGGFDWRDEGKAAYALSTKAERNPFETVLEFLAESEPRRWGPIGYADPPAKKRKGDDESDDSEDDDSSNDPAATLPTLDLGPTFLAKEGDRMALSIRIGGGNRPIVELGHWADGSSRGSFKLYAGNRSADRIARAMLKGFRRKATARQKANGQSGDLKTKGVMQLWEEDRAALIKAPFDVLTPMGGSFNFDPRGTWMAIDAGYSPNEHKHAIQASPVVEFLAAWGLEHARPVEFGVRQVRYAAWGTSLPPMLARAALGGGLATVPLRRFRFELGLSGKNKVVTFATEEPAHDNAHGRNN
jgi:CRISPR-associated protein Csx14